MATDAEHEPTDAGIPESTSLPEALVQIMVICFACVYLAPTFALSSSVAQRVRHLPHSYAHTFRHIYRFLTPCNCVASRRYMGQAIFPEIQSEMVRPIDFKKSIIAATVVLAVTYTVVGAVGYGVIGRDAPLLYVWDEKRNPRKPRTTAAAAFLVAHVLVGYIINASVVNQALGRWLFATSPVPRGQWLFLTTSMEVSYFVVANLVPNISDWMGLIAATGGA
jgi:hypothetical protein